MSQQYDYENDELYEDYDPIERLCNNPNGKEFFENMLFIGNAIIEEMEQREQNTAAKAPHIRGIKAAQDFERFIKEHRADIQHFERCYRSIPETLYYEVSMPKLFLEKAGNRSEVNRFSEILQEAEEFDFIEDEKSPEKQDMIHLYISFPTIIRVYKE